MAWTEAQSRYGESSFFLVNAHLKTSDYRERQLHDEALSGGNQPANISRSTVVIRLRLCSCHETKKRLLKNRKWGGLFNLTLSDIFRVEAPVTRRSPHRSGREDFPHPVPQNTQALRPCITGQVSLHPAHNSAARLIISDAISADEGEGTSY